MSVKIKTKPAEENRLESRIEGDVTIYTAAELKGRMAEDLHDCSGLEVNLEKVTKIDTSGYQLMLMLKKEAVNTGKTFNITSASEEVKRIFQLYRHEI